MSIRLEYCKLGAVIDITSGKECPPEKKTKTKTIPIMGANGIIGNSVEFLYDSPIILVGRVGSCGEVHRVDFPCWPSDNTLVITPKNNADFDYIEYCLRYGDFYPWISGSTQPLLTQTAIKRMEIPWPANEIREKIGNYGRKIDELIISNSELNAYVQQLISALFRSWFIDFDPVKAKAEGKLPNGMDEETARLFPDSFEDSELGPIPTGWDNCELQDLYDVQRGLSYTSKGLCEQGEGIPMVNLASFIDGGGYKSKGLKHYCEDYKQKFLIQRGDVLFSTLEQTHDLSLVGSPLIAPKEFEGKAIFSQDLLRSRPKSDNSPSRGYLYEWSKLRRMKMAVWATGTTITRIPPDALKRFPVLVPSSEILQRFEIIFEHGLKLQEDIRNGQLNLVKTRDALLPRLMSGELSVS